jgi:hypothetical protein
VTQPDWMQLQSIALHDGTDTPEWVPDNPLSRRHAGRSGGVTD